ncbi:MAG: hypothetical protein WD648_03325 [Planctomycetaceae bacterium]
MTCLYDRRTKHRAAVGSLISLFAMTVAANEGRAELPPSAYAKMQKEAPEALTIEVREVKADRTRGQGVTKVNVFARARVTAVERSKSNLKKGDIIFISYVHEKLDEPIPGPSQVPILKIGQQCPAFLEKLGNKPKEYRPAAGGYSFEKVKEPTSEEKKS